MVCRFPKISFSNSSAESISPAKEIHNCRSFGSCSSRIRRVMGSAARPFNLRTWSSSWRTDWMCWSRSFWSSWALFSCSFWSWALFSCSFWSSWAFFSRSFWSWALFSRSFWSSRAFSSRSIWSSLALSSRPCLQASLTPAFAPVYPPSELLL